MRESDFASRSRNERGTEPPSRRGRGDLVPAVRSSTGPFRSRVVLNNPARDDPDHWVQSQKSRPSPSGIDPGPRTERPWILGRDACPGPGAFLGPAVRTIFDPRPSRDGPHDGPYERGPWEHKTRTHAERGNEGIGTGVAAIRSTSVLEALALQAPASYSPDIEVGQAKPSPPALVILR